MGNGIGHSSKDPRGSGKSTARITFRILEKVMAILSKVEMQQLPWQMVQGGIKETERSGHAKMDRGIRARKLTRGLWSRGEPK